MAATVAGVVPERALWFGDGWAFVLQPIDASSTRLIVRYTLHPDVLVYPLLTYTIFEPAHFVMESGMMLGIKRRAERDPLISNERRWLMREEQINEAEYASIAAGLGRTAWYGAEACVALAFLYTLAFIGYAIVRSTLAILATPDIDAGLASTLIATWARLALPALVCAALAAIPAALIGALTALAIRALLALGTIAATPRRAVASGLAVCLVVSLALLALLTHGMGVTWTPATAATLTFWLLAPLVLYVIAGTVASWQVAASWPRRRTAFGAIR